MRRILAGLGGRLAVACSLIAVFCVVVTGAVMYTSARNNIFQSEQNRLLDGFSAMLEKASEPVPCVLAECATLTDGDLVGMASNLLKAPVLLVPEGETDPEHRKFLDTVFPASFQSQVHQTQQISWLRQRQGLNYTFLIGAPVTLTLQPVRNIGQPVPEQSQDAGPTPTPGPVSGTPDKDGRTVSAFMYASYYMGDQQRQVDDLAESTAWLVALMSLVAALAGIALARWIARPVRQLREAVESLDATHGTLDVNVSGVQELTGLVDAFNAAGRRLQETMAELTAKEAQSRRFVADVSHELRTPVTAMVAMADVLEHGGNGVVADGSVAEAAAVTARAARRLSVLTEDLLEISRFDAAQNTAHPETIDVGAHLAELMECRGLEADVEVDVAHGLAFHTDPRRLDVIVSNLLLNALNHGAKPVQLHAHLDGDQLVLEVGDNGPGVPEGSAGHLFDRFYKTDSSRSRGGTGLGLSLALENALLLGGTLELTSSSNPTTFTLRLPTLASQKQK